MKAVWLEGGQLRLRHSVPVPEPPANEALVRVLRAGICNTDVELARGYYPYAGVLGHEFVGVVERGPDELVGRRVVGEINVACGACAPCRAGRRTHCERRTVLGIVNRHGAFAEYLTLPAENGCVDYESGRYFAGQLTGSASMAVLGRPIHTKLFARHGGWLNNNRIARIGYNYHAGREVFRLVVGSRGSPIHWHIFTW